MGRHAKKDLDRKEEFIEYYKNFDEYHINIGKILKKMGIERELFDEWRKNDKKFEEKLKYIDEDYKDYLIETLSRNFIEKGDVQSGRILLQAIAKDRGFGDSKESNNVNTIADLMKKLATGRPKEKSDD